MREGHLEETLRRIIAQAVTNELADPRLGFVTVSEVRLNKDRSVAAVFVTVMGDAARQRDSLSALGHAERFLRQQIAGQLRLRVIPRLEFRYDESLDRSFRIEEILEDLHRQENPQGAADGPGRPPSPGRAPDADEPAPGAGTEEDEA